MEHAKISGRSIDLGAIEQAIDILRSAASVEVAKNDLTIEPGELRRALEGRRLRDRYFGKGLFEEPSWDMLLDLYAAKLEGRLVSISSLSVAANVAPTTALRWIKKLIDAGLFERHPHHFDRRVAYVELSDHAAALFQQYMIGMRRAGLQLG